MKCLAIAWRAVWLHTMLMPSLLVLPMELPPLLVPPPELLSLLVLLAELPPLFVLPVSTVFRCQQMRQGSQKLLCSPVPRS